MPSRRAELVKRLWKAWAERDRAELEADIEHAEDGGDRIDYYPERDDARRAAGAA